MAQDVAFCIAHTSPVPGHRHLVPFALRLAFPISLVGRDAHDYYETSVAVGLAPRKRSHIPSSLDVSSLT